MKGEEIEFDNRSKSVGINSSVLLHSLEAVVKK